MCLIIIMHLYLHKNACLKIAVNVNELKHILVRAYTYLYIHRGFIQVLFAGVVVGGGGKENQ